MKIFKTIPVLQRRPRWILILPIALIIITVLLLEFSIQGFAASEENSSLSPSGSKSQSQLAAVEEDNCIISSSVQCYVNQRNMERGDGSISNPYLHFRTGYFTTTTLANTYSLPAEIVIYPGYYAAGGIYDQPSTLTAPNGGVILGDIPQPILGDTTCSPSDRDCNVCVNNVVNSFQTLPNHYETMGFYLGDHPSPQFNLDIDDCGDGSPDEWFTNYHGHWQGIQRLSGSNNRHIIVTRDIIQYPCGSVTCEYPGFAVVNLDSSQGTSGGPFTSNRSLYGAPVPGDSVDQTVRRPSTHTHPGGVQVLGDILPVGTGPFVQFYDLTNPASLQIEEMPIGELPDRSPYNSSTTAMTKLANGHYLMAVSHSDAQNLDFYLSDGPNSLAEISQSTIKFSRIDRYLSPDKCPALRNDWDTYQSMNFVTDCSTGNLYLIATGNRDYDSTCWWWCNLSPPCCPNGSNHADLWQVVMIDEDTFWINWIDETNFPTNASDPEYGCNFDAAAGIYADPNHTLYLYCTEHASYSDSYVRFLQFGPSP